MINIKINDNSLLIIEKVVIDNLVKFRQSIGGNEKGGILLGKINSDYSKYIITDISEPTSKDNSGPYFFKRSKESAQPIILDKWVESKGEINYLGEWHTHQEKYPTPSLDDNILLKNSLKNNDINSSILFMVIVGIEGDLYVGYYKKGHRKMIQIYRGGSYEEEL